MTPRGEIVLLAGPGGTGRVTTYAGRALRLLREAGAAVTAMQGRDPDETLDLAQQAVRGGADSLVVCGGDAVVRIGAQAAAGSATRLGVVPAASGDLARCLGLARRDPDAAVGTVLAGRERTVDLVRCGSRLLVGSVSAGLDTAVHERASELSTLHPRLRRPLAVLDQLRSLEPAGFTLDLDGATTRVEARLVVVANTPARVAGLRLATDADPGDGLLDVVAVTPSTRRLEPARWRARRVTVAAPGVVAYADGERIGPLPLSVEAAPGALRVLVP